MKYNELEQYLSRPRLNRFLVATNNSEIKALRLYAANLRVAQAFYPILNLFEIFLRNACNNQISAYFNNSNWIIDEKNGFMSHPSLRQSKFHLKKSVMKAERKINAKRDAITAGKIIAEQSLGFWTSLFESHHYRLVGGVTIQIFEHKPPHINRSLLNQRLNRIRAFRNRIYHNEPICFVGDKIDFISALETKNTVFELTKWISPNLKDYLENFNRIEYNVEAAKDI